MEKGLILGKLNLNYVLLISKVLARKSGNCLKNRASWIWREQFRLARKWKPRYVNRRYGGTRCTIMYQSQILLPGPWIWENLKNPKKFAFFFSSLKKANCNQRSTFPVYFLSILNICFIENIFWPEICHRNNAYKMGAWWQNLRLANDSTLFSWIFDTFVDPGSEFI